LKERGHLADLCVDGRIILKKAFRNEMGGIEGIDLALDRDSLWVL